MVVNSIALAIKFVDKSR